MSLHKKVASFIALIAVVGAIGTIKRSDFQWREINKPYLPPIRILHFNIT